MFCHDPSTDSKFVPGIFPDTESPVPKIPGQLRSPKQDLFIRQGLHQKLKDKNMCFLSFFKETFFRALTPKKDKRQKH